MRIGGGETPRILVLGKKWIYAVSDML